MDSTVERFSANREGVACAEWFDLVVAFKLRRARPIARAEFSPAIAQETFCTPRTAIEPLTVAAGTEPVVFVAPDDLPANDDCYSGRTCRQ